MQRRVSLGSRFICRFNLDNLVVIIDRNNFQQTGASNDILDLNSLSSNGKVLIGKFVKLMVIILAKFTRH